MKFSTSMRLLAGLVGLAVLIYAPVARAADFNSKNCAWPLLFSPEGSGNIQGPDGAARYWIMPFDTQYTTMTIKGSYPNVRFFSFTAYETRSYDAEHNTNDGFDLVEDHLYDAQIAPDQGSVNPFVVPGGGNGTYTVVFSRTGSTSGNTIKVPSDPLPVLTWIVLRMYVSDDDPSQSGQSLMGGVPLPAITLAGPTGLKEMDTCRPINNWQDISAMGQFLFSPKAELLVDTGTPSSDRLWFASPLNPPSILWPNPDGKYLMMWPGEEYQPGRIIVMRGKAPRFPGAFGHPPKGASSRGQRGVDMRYWALCEQNFVAPLSLIGCVTDLNARLEGGDYTIVISDDRERPDWLRPDVNWLPYGDEQYPKFVVIRNMLPAAGFHRAIQDVWSYEYNSIPNYCTFDLQFPHLPNRKALDDKGPCAKAIMGDYYPDAFWCDKSTFVHGGWRACAKAH